MNMFYYIVFFFTGACFVSCGNCISYRVRHNMNWVHGHSICERCKKKLRAWELIPVISCILLKGRCSSCGYYFGYTHAQLEAIGGFLCILLNLNKDSLIDCITRLAVFGISYCGFCWIVAKNDCYN